MEFAVGAGLEILIGTTMLEIYGVFYQVKLAAIIVALVEEDVVVVVVVVGVGVAVHSLQLCSLVLAQ